jgi:autotransporter-associated beta strand protein
MALEHYVGYSKPSESLMKKSDPLSKPQLNETTTVAMLLRTVVRATICITVLSAFRGPAATLSWSGGGGNGNWSDSGNWGFAGTPASGDTLVFPAAQPRLINTNNISSLTLNQIRFVGAGGGYAIFGNALTITNGIEATNSTGANVLSNNITLGSPTDFVLDVAAGAKLTLGGTLNGGVGLVKTGGGTCQLAGGFSNAYAGSTSVSNGVVELFKNGAGVAAIPHDIIIGDGLNAATVRNLAVLEIADTGNVTVNRFSTWDLNGHNETISALTLNGATVTTGTGTLTLGGNLTSLASSTTASISGLLSLGATTRTFSVASGAASPDLLISANISDGGASAGIVKTGVGQLTLSGTNTYTGLTTVAGFLIVANDSALGANGSSTNGTLLNPSAFLLVQGANVGDEFLTLSNADDFRSSGAGSWAGQILLEGDVSINVFGGSFTNSGPIVGSGGITKGQSGTLIFSGNNANTYAGSTVVNQGLLLLSKPSGVAIFGSALVIGDDLGGADADIVRETAPNQIFSTLPITINSSGLLDLNNFSDAIGAITFNGGHLATGTGVANLIGDITANPSANNFARIDGNVLMSSTRTFNVASGSFSPDLQMAASVSGAGGLIKTGPGEMSLTSSNSYAGLTTVSNGLFRLEDSFALGATNSGTVVNSGAVLALLFGIDVGLEPLTLSGPGSGIFGALHSDFGSNSWRGAITLATNSTISVLTNAFLNLVGPISGTDDLTKTGPGTLIYSGSAPNTYSGSTFVNEGTLLLGKSSGDGSIHGPLIIGGNVGPLDSRVVRLQTTTQLGTVRVTVNSSGLLDVNGVNEGFGSLEGDGDVTLGGATINVGGDNTSTVFSGNISESGGLTKSGFGTLTLSGFNPYIGVTTIQNGKLIVDGIQNQSPVTIGASGTLGGKGTVGNITNMLGGVLAPGSSTAILTCSNVIFSGSSSDFTVELNGTNPGSGYDQLNVHGSVNLGGAALNVIPGFTPFDAPQQGSTFTIINNDGADAVTGTFAGLPNNAVFTNGLQFRINYASGDGNDVVLTITNIAIGVVSASVSAGNGDTIIQPNECDLLSMVITNFSGAPVTNVFATLLSKTPNIYIVQPFSTFPNLAANGRATNITPIQIAISPSFSCGDNLDLVLAVATANQGTFSIPFVVNSGSTNSAVTFNNNSIKIIPDGGSTNSTISVSAIVAPIAKVTVSLNLNHGQDSDLDIFLQGPDGTLVELSTDNGGGGNNYGNSCAQRTSFDDDAPTAITGGSPPFFGTFRPEGKLSDFRGKSGAAVNGTWTLLVTDDTANAITGELDCWTLNIFPATCAPGSGICELCPNVTLSGTLGSNSLQQTARLGTGDGTSCDVGKPCPGPAGSGNRSYDAYTFKNGATNACITVTLAAPSANLFSAAYSNSFNPANLCLNYLADAGTGTASLVGKTSTYSFHVPANATFVVTVNELGAGTGGAYTLNVTGSDCRPTLDINTVSTDKAVLDWTTAAAGFQLERTNDITAPSPWPPVTNVPIVVNGHFQVTNNISFTNQFYRLHKP